MYPSCFVSCSPLSQYSYSYWNPSVYSSVQLWAGEHTHRNLIDWGQELRCTATQGRNGFVVFVSALAWFAPDYKKGKIAPNSLSSLCVANRRRKRTLMQFSAFVFFQILNIYFHLHCIIVTPGVPTKLWWLHGITCLIAQGQPSQAGPVT